MRDILVGQLLEDGSFARVVQTQMENEAKMARQKAVFEQKLKSQEDRSRAVVAANQRLSNEIAFIQANISALQHRAQEVQAANEIMRTEMNTLEGKLVRGRAFLFSSLKNLDDSKAPQLAVLQKLKIRRGSDSQNADKRAKQAHRGAAADTKHKKRQVREVLMQNASDDNHDDPDEVSFLALGAVHMHGASQPAAGANAAGSPKDVLNMLGQAVTTLQQQEHLRSHLHCRLWSLRVFVQTFCAVAGVVSRSAGSRMT